MRFKQEFTAESASEVLEEMLRRDSRSLAGWADIIREEMERRGHNCTSSGGRFSGKHFTQAVGQHDSYLYEAVNLMDIILERADHPWLLEFLAAKAGRALLENGRSVIQKGEES